jgi:hypothetical protein
MGSILFGPIFCSKECFTTFTAYNPTPQLPKKSNPMSAAKRLQRVTTKSLIEMKNNGEKSCLPLRFYNGENC